MLNPALNPTKKTAAIEKNMQINPRTMFVVISVPSFVLLDKATTIKQLDNNIVCNDFLSYYTNQLFGCVDERLRTFDLSFR